MKSHPSGNFFITNRNKPLLIAHRGANRNQPENTLSAFREADKIGADAVECDVQITTDNQVVVFHDASFRRMTGTAGSVSQASWSDIQKLPITAGANWQKAQEHIPSLDELLQMKIPVQIELKSFYSRQSRQRLTRGVVELVTTHKAQDKIMIKSFDPFALLAVKRRAPDITCALLLPPGCNWLRQLGVWRRAYALCEIIEPGRVSISIIKRLQQDHKRVITWTVDNPALAKRYIAWGIDGIVTNDVTALQAL